jgi:hypothetical protein
MLVTNIADSNLKAVIDNLRVDLYNTYVKAHERELQNEQLGVVGVNARARAIKLLRKLKPEERSELAQICNQYTFTLAEVAAFI